MAFLRRYIWEKRRIFIVSMIFCIIFGISFRLYHLPVEAVIYPAMLCTILGSLIVAVDFFKNKQEHKVLISIHTMAEVVEELLPRVEGIKEEDYQQLLFLMKEEHDNYSTVINQKYADMIDYYTVWVHQIKTPIASMRLHLQNQDSGVARTLTSDLHRIEQYVEMVLTFLRLNSESTDYLIQEYDLDTIIRQAVKKFSVDFIDRKLSLVYEPVNVKVITDEKWLSFVIEQVLSNALKYTVTGNITIEVEQEKILRISDTGIGIRPEDLPRIFENGYTGYNGRTDKKASGIGLYLCRRICGNLGHTITARSTVDVGTTIDIDFTQTKLEVE